MKCLLLKHEDLSSDSQLPHQKLSMVMRPWDGEGGGYLELDGQSGKLYQQSFRLSERMPQNHKVEWD